MNDTPRTDSVLIDATISADAGDFLPVLTAMIKHARELERENTKLQAEIEKMDKTIESLSA